MKRLLIPGLLLAVIAVGAIGRTPASAQDAGTRFMFADTTLLRDTLDLHFNRLFPLADSLRMVPDSLRALSVRYQLSLERLVLMADSMRVPVDSVGSMIAQAQFNPLTAAAGTTGGFRYTSSYNIGQTNNTWTNGSDYSLARGPLFMHTVMQIALGNYKAGAITSKRQTRLLSTEVGWKLSPDFSLGGRANLQRFANLDQSIYNVSDNSDEFQLSMRSKQHPVHGMDSELNFFSGLLDQSKSNGGKRGVSGDLNGRMIYTRGEWLSQSLDGQVTGNIAHTTPPGTPTALDTRDLSSNLRGSVALFEALPIGLNVNFGLRNSRVENPVARPPSVQPVLTNSRDLDVALRLRRDADRYINLDQAWSESQNSTVSGLGTVGAAAALTTAGDREFSVDGRYALLGFGLDARFTIGHPTSRSPRRSVLFINNASDTVDYREQQVQRGHSIEATLSRQLGPRITARATGNVSLDQYDYTVDDYRAQPTYPRDQYSQTWRIETLYTPTGRFNTGATFEVSRTLYLNLTSASSSSNSENRSYRAEWRWNCRLLTGLTATQRNNILASYDYLTFQTDQNRLSLDYSTVTTLNAVLTPRLTLDINHNARYQPRGGYNREDDGREAFSPGDESRNYLLSARIAYTPVPSLALTLQPDFQQYDRNARTSDGTVPQTRQRQLNFSGGANLNLAVGGRGRLTGNIQRTFNSARTISYTVANSVSPRSALDYWNGTLQFSWTL